MSVNRTVTIPPTDTLAIDCFRVPFIDDNIPELDETFTVSIVETLCDTIFRSETTVVIGSKLKSL